jgi:anti-anti-sigma factor
MSPTPSGKPRARPAAPRLRVLRLGAIAMAAGAFSGLFGVGGGTIIGPLLVLWLGLFGVALANAVSERARAVVRRRAAVARLATRQEGGTPLGSRPVEILEVKTEDRNGLVHVALMGELDLSTVAKVQEELRRVEADSPPTVVVDLSKLTFLDSTGLRCIVTADERARDEGRRVVIVRGPDPVQRVFAITRLEERLEMVDDAGTVR